MPKDSTLRGTFLVLLAGVCIALALAAQQLVAGNQTNAIALIGLAATLGLATAAVLALEQNRGLVAAAIQEASTSAETVKQMKAQMEVANRPWLVITANMKAGLSGLEVMVKNIGTGPATNIRLAGQSLYGDPPHDQWFWGEHAGIAADGYWQADLIWSFEPGGQRYLCIVEGLPRDEVAIAVRYDDWFDGHYRSVLGRGPEPWTGHATAADAPRWMQCT